MSRIGVAVPGLASGSACLWAPNLPYLDGLDLARMFSGVTVALGNDAQLALLAEAALGAARNAADVILLAIGTGIGSAVLADGRIVHGPGGAAASFGWACADPADPGDPNLGWLERNASGTALDAIARRAGLTDARALIAAARAGDRAARKALEKPCAALGAAIAGAVALLGSQSVIVSGGVAEGIDALAPLILPVLKRHLPPHLRAITLAAGGVRRARESHRRGPRRAWPSALGGESLMTLTIRAVRPDRNRPEPLWRQTELALRALIADGTWVDGAQLPNEARLGEMLGVSRITMRHALRNLEEWGLLRREQGRGTFVSSSTVIAGVRGPTSFTQEMADRGLTAASRVLELRAARADNTIASALEIREGAAVCKIRRVRFGGGQPIGIQTAYLPAKRVPGLIAIGELPPSLYATLRDRFGLVPQSALEIYRVGAVGKADAELLEVAVGSPAFIVQRITSDARGPYEFTVSTMRGDRYEIRSKLRF